ncbi:hypothetical protein [Flavobacterium sp.]|uniref:hypothetical protein n=1 Tax=Flavobacterium sp. TaxID=239 RepID=UPI001215AD97|nr:hypothetical protein [Flavobacterium sp.]RZJ70735.1 MAG: hypothetical protein EOO49_12850 [Flavobacterium sp.]
MSSTICRFKILETETRVPSPQEIVERCYDNREDTFNGWCKDMGIALSKDAVDRRVKVDRFVELVSEAYRKDGSGFLDAFVKKDFYYIELVDTLRKSYESQGVLEIVSYHTLFWNNLFASLGYADYKPAEVTEIKVEIAQVYPGINVFPKYTINDTVTKRMERHFLTRILSDIENNDAIANWFGATGSDLAPSDNSMHIKSTDRIGADGIVWGFQRGKDLIAKPDNAAFRKKYKDAWWLEELPTDIDEGDQDYPIKVVEYSVFVHPKWFPEIDKIVAGKHINDSTAYY